MKRIILSCLFVWFLVIQSFGSETSAFVKIPMQDYNYCNNAISQIKIPVWYIKYTCIDVGNV